MATSQNTSQLGNCSKNSSIGSHRIGCVQICTASRLDSRVAGLTFAQVLASEVRTISEAVMLRVMSSTASTSANASVNNPSILNKKLNTRYHHSHTLFDI